MKEAAKEIARALRCAATVGDYDRDCAVCRYYRKEMLTQAQQEMIGVEEWCGCDVEQICLDAADLIERLAEDAGKRVGRMG